MPRDDRSRGFSHLVRAADVPPDGLEISVEVAEAERAVLAERFGVTAVERMTLAGTVRPWRRDGLRVEAVVSARIEQACVVSLEPVWSDIEETFAATFAPPGRDREADGREIVIDALEEDEPPETMIDGAADIGAVAAEYLALAIDPYPRRPEARLEDELPVDETTETDEKQEVSAFEALRRLKRGTEGGDHD